MLQQIGFYSPSYLGSVSTLLHFEGSDGSTTFTDVKGKVYTSSNATITTADFKFGSSCGSFGGSNSYITTPHSANLVLSDGDYTVELWVKFDNFSNDYQCLFCKYGADDNAKSFQYNYSKSMNRLDFFIGNALHEFAVPLDINVNTWHHIALVRAGSTLYGFVDGLLLVKSEGAINNYTDGGYPLYLARLPHSNPIYQYQLNGKIDEFCLTKGVAKYTANFTPPTQAFLDN
jgi:hypothetical protein